MKPPSKNSYKAKTKSNFLLSISVLISYILLLFTQFYSLHHQGWQADRQMWWTLRVCLNSWLRLQVSIHQSRNYRRASDTELNENYNKQLIIFFTVEDTTIDRIQAMRSLIRLRMESVKYTDCVLKELKGYFILASLITVFCTSKAFSWLLIEVSGPTSYFIDWLFDRQGIFSCRECGQSWSKVAHNNVTNIIIKVVADIHTS